MTKYEDALKVIAKNNRMIGAMREQVETTRNDKTGMLWDGKSGQAGCSVVVGCRLYHGSRGSSSTYNSYVDGIEGAIAVALNNLKPQIIEATIAVLVARTAKAAALAKDEAEQVLANVGAAVDGAAEQGNGE